MKTETLIWNLVTISPEERGDDAFGGVSNYDSLAAMEHAMVQDFDNECEELLEFAKTDEERDSTREVAASNIDDWVEFINANRAALEETGRGQWYNDNEGALYILQRNPLVTN